MDQQRVVERPLLLRRVEVGRVVDVLDAINSLELAADRVGDCEGDVLDMIDSLEFAGVAACDREADVLDSIDSLDLVLF